MSEDISIERVRREIAASNKMQKELAIDLHVSEVTINKWANGKGGTIRTDNLSALASYLGVRVEYLRGEDDFRTEDDFNKNKAKELREIAERTKNKTQEEKVIISVGYDLLYVILTAAGREVIRVDIESPNGETILPVKFEFTEDGEEYELDKSPRELIASLSDLTEGWIKREAVKRHMRKTEFEKVTGLREPQAIRWGKVIKGFDERGITPEDVTEHLLKDREETEGNGND